MTAFRSRSRASMRWPAHYCRPSTRLLTTLSPIANRYSLSLRFRQQVFQQGSIHQIQFHAFHGPGQTGTTRLVFTDVLCHPSGSSSSEGVYSYTATAGDVIRNMTTDDAFDRRTSRVTCGIWALRPRGLFAPTASDSVVRVSLLFCILFSFFTAFFSAPGLLYA